MTHEDAGKYAAKHTPGTNPDEKLAAAVKTKVVNNGITCGATEAIAKDLGLAMAAVGQTADLLELKIHKCQLGLFGWGAEQKHGKDIRAVETVAEDLKDVLSTTAREGVVTCAELWGIASRLGIERKKASSACETLNLKIRGCQLGTF